jgi:hypothetical protein
MDEFDSIELNLKSSREHITQFEENLKALNDINYHKKRLEKIRKICDELSKKTPYELVNILHFVLFFTAFAIQLLNLKSINKPIFKLIFDLKTNRVNT